MAAVALGFAQVNAAVQLKMSLTNGSAKTFLLSQKPVITMPGEEINVAVQEASFSCLRAEVASMEFEEAKSSSIEVLKVAEQFSDLNGTIVCIGSPIDVYDLQGALRLAGVDELSTQTLSAGIYIVKTNQHVVKIIKK